MILRSFVFVLIVTAMISCEDDAALMDLPPKNELINILMDLHVAEGTISRVPFSQRDSIGLILRDRVALDYGYTGEELEDIIKQLQFDLELSDEVYDSVLVRLDALIPEPSTK